MMVTFISQCEKNALNKTRRVLDAFADRIGTNTWQTVITEDGLFAVKKMLCASATKSTAISCFWVRSRSRSDLLWVVGNKSRFNERGLVPVNYTSKELKTDENKIMTNIPYANIKKQSLEQHLFAVGYTAYCLAKKLTNGDDKLSKAIFVAGCLHDIGKIDPVFQAWILSRSKEAECSDDLLDEGQHIDKGKFTFDKYARHNEISLLLYKFCDDTKILENTRQKDFVEHGIYWHHAKPIRKKEYNTYRCIYKPLEKSIGFDKFCDFLKSARTVVQSVNDLTRNYQETQELQSIELKTEKNNDMIDGFKSLKLPAYKEYEFEDSISEYGRSITQNSKKNIVRACVITADRLVSALSPKKLEDLINNKTLHCLIQSTFCKDRALSEQIRKCLDGFDFRFPDGKRNKMQSEAARKLMKVVQGVPVLKGPAGCGKTKIALEWALLTDVQKIIWVCPRVQICESLFFDFTSEEYLPNAKIEICTGDFKYIQKNGYKTVTPVDEEFSGDIVLTTIDQILGTIVTHTSVTGLIEFMGAHVVFDEYHEYIHMPAFNLLFAELVECKKQQGSKSKVLLVSATPNDFFIKEFLRIDADDIISINSFNESKYQIDFVVYDEAEEGEENPLFQTQTKNSIVVSNTAIGAQRSFIQNQARENAILFHGKFTKKDKIEIFNKVYESFKKGGNRQYGLLRGGPIIQASLNITCDHMVTEFTHAENWLQRLGRLDRFGERDEINQYITAVPSTLAELKGTGKCARFLSELNSLSSAKAWYEFLQDRLRSKIVTINELYILYADFYKSDRAIKAVEQDLMASLKESVNIIAKKVHDPVCVPKKSRVKKLKKCSLRGDSRYVQMAVIYLRKDGVTVHSNEYACDGDQETFTMSVNEVEGYGQSSDKDLLAYMYKKNHKILSVKQNKVIKQEYKPFVLKEMARERQFPIYVSYTYADLKLNNDDPHVDAIYYAIGENQVIGSISLEQIKL